MALYGSVYLSRFVILALQENIYNKVMKTYYMSARFAGRHVVGFRNLSIDMFLEVQDQRYSQTFYLIDYIAHGLHLSCKIKIFKKLCRNPI